MSNNIDFDPTMLSALEISDSLPQGRRESVNTAQTAYGASQLQKYEQEVKELRQERCHKEKRLSQLLQQVESLNEQAAQTQIELFQAKKERDLSRFHLEQLVAVLKRRNLYDDILREVACASGQPLDLLEAAGPSVLEEYQARAEEQKRELQEKDAQIRQLHREQEQLVEQAHQDTRNLELKEQEIERLKRSLNKLQKETVSLRRSGGPSKT